MKPPSGPGPVLLGQGVAVPPFATAIQGWRVSDFIGTSSGSYLVALEYAKYCLERDDLEKAAQHLERAEGMALEKHDTRRFLEVQIFQGFRALYSLDLKSYGQILMKIKPLLSKETYASFLGIYNRAGGTASSLEVAKLAGGVAMGAEHFASARRLLSSVVRAQPGDTLAWRLLGQAQMELRDYNGAEASFRQLVQLMPDDPEAYLNLARFYLTAKFTPDLARQHVQMAANLRPDDGRLAVLFSLLDLMDGKAKEAVARLKRLQKAPADDQGLTAMVQRILQDPELTKGGDVRARLSAMLLLPGAVGASPEVLQQLGEDFLLRGSYFQALKVFIEGHDLPEIGRAYLSMASNQFAAGEEKAAAVSAGFGMNALQEELKHCPTSAKAHLYLALYYSQRHDRVSSQRHVQAGLSCPAEIKTRRQLQALKAGLS